MSEERGSYVTAGESSRREVTCECGNPLWTEVIAGDLIYLVFGNSREGGGIMCQHYSGGCLKCGRVLEWHANQVRLDRLINKLTSQRENVCTQT